MNDLELLCRIESGDGDAWNLFYDRYLPTLWRFVVPRVGGDVHAAEDIVAEVMMNVARNAPSIDQNLGTLATWLLGVARNKIVDYVRRETRRQQADFRWSQNSRSQASIEVRRQSDADAAAAVAAALDRLSDEETLILQWKYVERMTVREIANRLEKSEKSIESLLYRARRSFRTQFDRCSQVHPNRS